MWCSRFRLLLVLTLIVGCAAERPHADPESSEPIVDAGGPSRDDADTRADADAIDASDVQIAPPAAPPAGECGVVRRLSIPAMRVVRAPNGFVVGPELESWGSGQDIEWLAVSEDGRRRRQFTGKHSPELSLATLPVGHDPFAGNALNLMRAEMGSDERVSVELISDGVPRTSRDLGAAFYRGTIQNAAAVSLDGTRVVYATGHVAVDKPHAFMIDESGARVGDPLVLSQQTSPSFSCLNVVPTGHGAVVSFIEQQGSTSALRLIEIGSGATVLQDVTWDRAYGCPLVQLAARGLWAVVPSDGNMFDLLAIDAGQVTVRESGLSLRPRWIGETDEGELLYLVARDGEAARVARKDPGNNWAFVAGDSPPTADVIAAEWGRLFLRSWPTLEERELVEVACGQLPRLALPD